MSLTLTKMGDDLRQEFFRLTTKQDVASLLEVNYSRLAYHLYANPSSNRYTPFTLPKKSGGFREISAPNPGLKIIQQKLNCVLQQVFQRKPCVQGFTCDRDILTNARPHCKQRFVFNLDLKNFFPSINFGRVRGLFLNIPYGLNEEVATVLSQICCWENALPQGAPTSPVISNMICAKMDSQLQQLAKENRCFYTRYADDLTFSTNIRSFPRALATIETSPTGDELQIGSELNRIIRENGFEINNSKVRLQRSNSRQEVTGLTANLFPNVKRTYTRQIRAMLHAWEKFGLEAAEGEFRSRYDSKYRNPAKEAVSFKQVVKGKIEFFGHVRGREHPTYLVFCDRLRELAPELVKAPVVEPSTESPAMTMSVRTEGKTDWKHLKAAYRNLKQLGLFQGFSVEFNEVESDVGGDELLNFCRQVAKLEYHTKPIVCIFDRDVKKIVDQATDKGKLYKDWGNNVFSFVLSAPKHREDNPEVCIELYYKDDEITRPNEFGRRLFLSTEFHERSGRHKISPDLNYGIPNRISEAKTFIIDDKVFNPESQNVALSKNDFATNVLNQVANFNDFDFSEFEKVFEVISAIANSVSS